jgi:beta-lactamase regulating signal transducer with metallopeptidase domain
MMDSLPATALAWTLVHFVWQGAAIGFAAFLLMSVCRRSSPARYGIGVLALAAMMAAPAVTFVSLLDDAAVAGRRATRIAPAAVAGEPAGARPVVAAPDAATLSSHAAGARPAGPPATDRFDLLQAIPLFWFAGVLVLSLRLAGGFVVARRLAARGVGPVAPDIAALAARLSDRLALGRAVRIYESSRVAVPMVVGWMRPVVLMPAAALAGLSPTQIEALIAHELAHVRRHDYAINLLQSIAETLLFYHPAVWWVSRQVRVEREHCCDEIAVGLCDRLAYATALTELARRIDPAPRLALAATDGRLLDRVRRILGRPAGASPALTVGSGALMLVVLLLGIASVPAAMLSIERPDTTWLGEAPQTAQPGDPSAPTRTGSGTWRYSVDGQRIEIAWTGAFRIADDEKSIAWIEPGHKVRLTNGARWFASGVEIIALEDGTLEPHHFRGGFEKPFEPDGRRYMESTLERLVMRAGLAAPARVARLLQEGGPDGVRAEIDRLESDSVRRTYALQLIQQAELPPAAAVALVRSVVDRTGSDAVKASLIRSAAPAAIGDEDATVALIEATKGIASDTSQRRALEALLPDQPSPRVAAAVIDAAAGLGSDSQRYATLLAVATRGGLTPETRPAFFVMVNAMQSSSYRGRLLSDVGAGSDVPAVTVRAVLDASRGIGSDTERRRVVAAAMADRVDPATAPQLLDAMAIGNSSQRAGLLQAFVDKGGLTAETAPAFFELVGSMSSGSYQRRVLDDVSAQASLPAAVVSGFLDAAAKVRGDSDRAQVLMGFVRRHAVTGADRERYLVAADGIGSETYQNRVLAALVRAERQRRR